MSDKPLRDAKGHYAEVRCINAHDRCYLGANENCPYCERICAKCRTDERKEA